uniref:Uncharacterized protein n=1 Tax=Micrurus spixii TaxID=129469 RepID=A0A2D4NKI8_9SAUR
MGDSRESFLKGCIAFEPGLPQPAFSESPPSPTTQWEIGYTRLRKNLTAAVAQVDHLVVVRILWDLLLLVGKESDPERQRSFPWPASPGVKPTILGLCGLPTRTLHPKQHLFVAKLLFSTLLRQMATCIEKDLPLEEMTTIRSRIRKIRLIFNNRIQIYKCRASIHLL